jgi:hypothetical protein
MRPSGFFFLKPPTIVLLCQNDAILDPICKIDGSILITMNNPQNEFDYQMFPFQ